MKNPPKKTSTQQDYVSTALRLPKDLHGELTEAAKENGRSLNAEMLARLRYKPSEVLSKDISEIKSLLRAALDQR